MPAYGDKAMIQQAIANLVDNAVKFSPAGGTVRLTASISSMVFIAVSDEGPGIANLELAMTDGWTSGTGLGMGLSGSRRLVNEFEIDSRAGVGTRVTIARWK